VLAVDVRVKEKVQLGQGPRRTWLLGHCAHAQPQATPASQRNARRAWPRERGGEGRSSFGYSLPYLGRAIGIWHRGVLVSSSQGKAYRYYRLPSGNYRYVPRLPRLIFYFLYFLFIYYFII